MQRTLAEKTSECPDALRLSMHLPAKANHNRFELLRSLPSPPQDTPSRSYQPPLSRRFRRNRGRGETKRRRDARRTRRNHLAIQALEDQLSRDIGRTLDKANLYRPPQLRPTVDRATSPRPDIPPAKPVHIPATPPQLPVLDFGGLDLITDFPMLPSALPTPPPEPPLFSPILPIWCPQLPAFAAKRPKNELPVFFDLSSLSEPLGKPEPATQCQQLQRWQPQKSPQPVKHSRFFPPRRMSQQAVDPVWSLQGLFDTRLETVGMPAELDVSRALTPYVHSNGLTGHGGNERAELESPVGEPDAYGPLVIYNTPVTMTPAEEMYVGLNEMVVDHDFGGVALAEELKVTDLDTTISIRRDDDEQRYWEAWEAFVNLLPPSTPDLCELDAASHDQSAASPQVADEGTMNTGDYVPSTPHPVQAGAWTAACLPNAVARFNMVGQMDYRDTDPTPEVLSPVMPATPRCTPKELLSPVQPATPKPRSEADDFIDLASFLETGHVKPDCWCGAHCSMEAVDDAAMVSDTNALKHNEDEDGWMMFYSATPTETAGEDKADLADWGWDDEWRPWEDEWLTGEVPVMGLWDDHDT